VTTTTLRPSEAYRIATTLQARGDRPAAALRSILRERGHGSITELHRAMHVSKTTIGNWQTGGGWDLGPERVYQLAVAYACGDEAVVDPGKIELTDEDRRAVDELFDAFYSDNHRDAVIWLSHHKPNYFRCSPQPCDRKVA